MVTALFINFGKIWERATGPVADIDRAPFGVHADVSLNRNLPLRDGGGENNKKTRFREFNFLPLPYRIGGGGAAT